MSIHLVVHKTHPDQPTCDLCPEPAMFVYLDGQSRCPDHCLSMREVATISLRAERIGAAMIG